MGEEGDRLDAPRRCLLGRPRALLDVWMIGARFLREERSSRVMMALALPLEAGMRMPTAERCSPYADVSLRMMPTRMLTTLIPYGIAVAVVACALLVMLLIPPLKTHTPFLLFFPAVMTAGWSGGLGPALVATAVSAVSAHYFILPPAFSFALTVVTGIQLAGFVAVAVFISLLQGSLRQARARFEVTLRSIGEGVITTDVEGRVTFMNPVAEALTGWPDERAHGRPFTEVLHLLHRHARQPVENPVTRILREGTVVGLDTPPVLIAPDGTEHSIDASGAPIRSDRETMAGVVLVFRDVTERQRTEAALARAAALLELTYESILVLDLDYTITFWNRGATLMYGWTAEEAVGQVASRLLRTQFPKPFEAIKAELFRDGRWEGDLVHTTRAGASLVVASRWTLERDADGQPLAFLELNSDITARKHAEDALQQLNATLEQRVQARTQELAETNAALEAFAASVAHDLRAPLRSIHGFAQALADDYGAQLEPTGQDFLRRILRASTRMDALIQDLLTYSRLSREALPLEPVPLQAAVQAAQAQLHGGLQARHAVLQLDAPLPAVIAHYPVLVQVLVNVLSNAIKFTDPAVRPVVTVRADRTEGRVRLWIEDNGIGIPAEYQERIFEVFERLHGPDAYAGTGMGLAIVRRGVERMGGQVGVVSAPGQGSRFWLTFRPADEGA